MSAVPVHRRGQPVLFLAMILLGWTGLRLATFETPWPTLPPIQRQAAVLERQNQVEGATSANVTQPQAHTASTQTRLERAPIMLAVERELAIIPERILSSAQPLRESEFFVSGHNAAGHSLLWSAAMARLPMPTSVAALLDRTNPGPPAQPSERAASRWRIDGWLLLRGSGPAGVSGGQRAPSYGASQLGAVLSYRLAPQSSRAPSAYLRASHALIDSGESEVALGVRLRPLPSLPVTAHAELRATRRPGSIELRPAAFVSGGFERDGLPLGLRARGYAAGGYVGGDFATAFVDGQAAVDAEVTRFDLGSLRAGAGSWGGAQRGAARLDLGPTASIEVKLGEVPARLSLDYRRRVAGDAAPASGGALTLSTGF